MRPDGVPRFVACLKTFCNSFVGIAEALFQTQNLLAHYREAKMSRLDDARVNRADRDLMDTIAFYLDNG